MLPDWTKILKILTFRLDHILGNPQNIETLTFWLDQFQGNPQQLNVQLKDWINEWGMAKFLMKLTMSMRTVIDNGLSSHHVAIYGV